MNSFKKDVFCLLTVMMMLFAAGSGQAGALDEQKRAAVYRMFANYSEDFPEVPVMTPHTAMEMAKDERAVFVDVREPEEMAVSMLPGAVPAEIFLKNPDRWRNQTIVLYCTIGYRSGKLAQELAAKGISTTNLAGGILGWVFEGGRVYRHEAEVKKVHVYGKKWNYLPAGYEPVMFGLLHRFFG